MSQPPSISVVLPTFNRRELLERTLPTVLEQDFPAHEFEVIVVVDGSTDGTAEWLRSLRPSCGFKVIEQENRGQKAALNAGVRAASGRLILFLDDDLLCDKSLLAEHAAGHAGGGFTLVFGRIRVAPESPPTLETEAMRTYLENHYEQSVRGGQPVWPYAAVVGPNCSLSRTRYLDCGGYDESLPRRYEDVELGLRLWKIGCQFKYQPKAIIYHLCLKSSGERARDLAYEGRSMFGVCRMYPDYRAHNTLMAVVRAPAWKRLFYRTLAGLPFSATIWFAPFIWLISKLARVSPGASRLGLRLHDVRQNVAWFQGAIAEPGSWKEFHNVFRRRLPVLAYHRIGTPAPLEWSELTVTPQKFERQIQWLAKHGYVGIKPCDWLAWCREGKDLPEKPVLLTFDDAYRDLTEHAFPVLKRYGFNATVFVVTQHLGKTNSWDQGSVRADLPLMTVEQVRYWANQGFEFGGHTRTHPDLTSVDNTRLTDEVEGGAQDLEHIVGKRAISFAYPHGLYNETVRQCAEKAFALAFTCDEGLNCLTTHPHLLQRTEVQPQDTLLDFGLRVRLGYDPLHDLRGRLRIRTRLRGALGLLKEKK